MRWIKPYFPLAHGIPRVEDRRIVSRIIFVTRIALRWRGEPPGYGPHKTIVRWSLLGVVNKTFAALVAKGGKPSGSTEPSERDRAHTFFSATCLATTVIFWV